MTLEDLQKIVDEATPGPWYASGSQVATEPGQGAGYPPSPACIASLYDGEYIENGNGDSDAAFIAAARTMLPKLLKVAMAAKRVDENMFDWYLADDRKAVAEAQGEITKALAELEKA